MRKQSLRRVISLSLAVLLFQFGQCAFAAGLYISEIASPASVGTAGGSCLAVVSRFPPVGHRTPNHTPPMVFQPVTHANMCATVSLPPPSGMETNNK
ncbi:MAG: hypothetical protein V3V96_14025 [Acidiferrobacterales bacterium]